MQEVRMELSNYDALQKSISAKSERIDALENEISKLKEEHEAEIERMAKEGQVRCISIKKHPLIPFLVSDKKEYKGFDDVKAEVYEHFKQGLFDEELEKYKKEQLDSLMKKLSENEETIQDLRYQLSRMENRSLIARICNK